jgi:hypothetical protein
MIEVFEPLEFGPPGRTVPPLGIVTGARSAVRGLVDYYRRRTAWLSLVVTSIALCYLGGAAMFWFHAVALNEGGPAISWYAHWLLDSTVGFVALTPALFLILPLATWAAVHLAGERVGRRPAFYVAITGLLFSLLTVPGPVVHDLLVARGTWLANTATRLIGDPNRALPPGHDYPLASTLTSQLGFAIPTYVLMTAAALLAVRWITGRRQRALQIESLAITLGRRARGGRL